MLEPVKKRTKFAEREQLASQPSPHSSVSPLMDAYHKSGEGLGLMSLLTPRYSGDDLSDIHGDEELRFLTRQLEYSQFRYQARMEHLMEMKNQQKTHMEGGLRFTMLWSTSKDTMHYHSFDELGLKDCSDRDLVISGFKRNLETIPTCIGFFCVGDALYMVGGQRCTKFNDILQPIKCLWSALPPPDGSFSESWTLCPVTMKLERDIPILAPLHDGRIFICGGTSEREGWAEIYDPKKGQFNSKNFTNELALGCPHAISCFQWTDQVVMVYYHFWMYSEVSYQPCKPSLLSYNIVEDKWDKFEDNFPPPLYDMGNRNLVYVGGNILFIIDYACLWVVYDLSSRKEVGEVCLKARPRGERVPVNRAFYAGNKDIKSSSWVIYIFMRAGDNNYCDQEYAKVEVVQGKGGDYTATVQMKGVLKVGPYHDIYIYAEKDRKGKQKKDDRQVNERLC